MNREYRAWLLLQGPPNADLQNVITSLGLFSKLDLEARHEVTLGCRGSRAVLSARQPDRLFRLVFERRRLLALSTAPMDELATIHGKTFFSQGLHLTVRLAAESDNALQDPYFRRLVYLEYSDAYLQEDAGDVTTVVETLSENESKSALILEPIAFRIEEQGLRALLAAHGRALKNANGLLLPPVRGDVADTYFAEPCLSARAAIAHFCDLGLDTSGQPTMVTLWQLADDPFLRDILLDGGRLLWVGDDGKPTRGQLEFCKQDDDPIASYRRRFLTGDNGTSGPRWAGDLKKQLCKDLESLLPNRLLISSSCERLDWSVFQLRPWQKGGAPTGTWQRFSDFNRRITDKKTRTFVEGKVLVQSRQRFTASEDPDNNPDHDLAERLFISQLWRCPWSASTDNGPWRLALSDLLASDLTKSRPTPGQRIENWHADGWLQFSENMDGTKFIVYPPSVDSPELEKWRLLMPLGTIFRTHTGLILNDDISKLDRGYVLS